MSQRTTAKNPIPLDLVFAALADATRRAILDQLSNGESSVSELAAPHDMSLPAVSKHLRVLEDAGLLARRVDGRTHFLSVNAKPLDAAVSWMERHRQFWGGGFDRLAALVEKPESDTSTAISLSPKPKR
ncbi:MAG: ArsR family transcriptional regulator [Verrucomicrobiaceae bacterium]|nr:ArsR family transcriptional regulator [Verrucomicrobiaceae bacterium]